MKKVILFLLIACGCTAPSPKFARTYRTSPVMVKMPLTRLETPSPAFEIQDLTAPELPKASRIWLSSNSTPMLICCEWENWPTNLVAVFESSTNLATWERTGSDGCAGTPPGPITRNASTVARGNFTAIRLRQLPP